MDGGDLGGLVRPAGKRAVAGEGARAAVQREFDVTIEAPVPTVLNSVRTVYPSDIGRKCMAVSRPIPRSVIAD